MKSWFIRSVIIAGIIFIGVGSGWASTTIFPNDPNIQYMGRIDFTYPLAPVIGWASSSITINFLGTSLKGTFSSTQKYGKDYLAVMIDGNFVGSPIAPAKTATTYTLASGLADTTHIAVIIKRTEYWGDVTFTGFILDTGRSLVAPPPLPPYRIEWYGDSNVSAHDSEDIYDLGNPQYNDSWFGYAGIVSRMLNAQWQNMGWGGSGWTSQSSPLVQVIWNYTNPANADKATSQATGSQEYTFSQFPADVVVVNAGSNDSYKGNDSSQIIPAWEDFVLNKIRPVHPNAHVVLAESVGWSFYEPGDYIAQAVADLNAKGEYNVSSVVFPWLWGQSHAVVEEQAGFANIVAAHIAAVKGWPAPTPSPLSSFAGTGVMFNTGFETVPYSMWTNRQSQASGWREWTKGTGATTVVTNASAAHSGSRYAQLTVGSKNGEAGFWQAAPVVLGKTYTVTGFVKGTANKNIVMKVQFKDEGQNILSESNGNIAMPTVWTQYTNSATAPSNAYSVNVVLQLDGTNAIADFDDVVLSSN